MPWLRWMWGLGRALLLWMWGRMAHLVHGVCYGQWWTESFVWLPIYSWILNLHCCKRWLCNSLNSLRCAETKWKSLDVCYSVGSSLSCDRCVKDSILAIYFWCDFSVLRLWNKPDSCSTSSRLWLWWSDRSRLLSCKKFIRSWLGWPRLCEDSKKRWRFWSLRNPNARSLVNNKLRYMILY